MPFQTAVNNALKKALSYLKSALLLIMKVPY